MRIAKFVKVLSLTSLITGVIEPLAVAQMPLQSYTADAPYNAPMATPNMGPMGSVDPITTIPSPSMTPPPECTVTAQPGGGFGALTTSCGFYQEMSNRTGCSDTTQYPIGYGYKYCVQFGALAQQVPELAPWIGQTMNCLQDAIKGLCGSGKSCDEIKSSAFASHAACYAGSRSQMNGVSVCDRTMAEGFMIALMPGSDLASSDSAKQIAQTLINCGGKYLTYAQTYMSQYFTGFTKPGPNDSPGISAGRECAGSVSMISINPRYTQCINCCGQKGSAGGYGTSNSFGKACQAVCKAQFK